MPETAVQQPLQIANTAWRFRAPGMLTRGRWLVESDHVYALFAVVLLSYNLVELNHLSCPFGVDYWEHLAAIGAFARHPLRPDNPYLPGNAPTHLLTPHHLLWGLIARLTGTAPFKLTAWIGTAYLVSFLVGIRMFASRVLGSKRCALVLAVALLFFWLDAWPWSGFYNFGVLPVGSTYPYFGVLGLSLIAMSLYLDVLRFGVPVWITCALVVALAFVSHPLTGIFLAIALAIRVVLGPGTPLEKVPGLLSILVGLGMAFCWPYFSVFEAMTSKAYSQDGFAGDYRRFYDNVPHRLWPAMLGFAYLIPQLWKRRVDFTVAGFVVFAAAYGLNFVTFRSAVFARFIIYVAFFLQVAAALALTVLPPLRWRPLAVIGGLSLALYGYRNQLSEAALWTRPAALSAESPASSNLALYEQAQRYSAYFSPSDVVLARKWPSWRLPALAGCKVVGVAKPNPFLSDFHARLTDVRQFFDEATSGADRQAILLRHRPTFVLAAESDRASLEQLEPVLSRVYRDGTNVLFKVVLPPPLEASLPRP